MPKQIDNDRPKSLHLSKRMCSELNRDFTHDKRNDDYPGWYQLKRILDAGAMSKSGTTVDLQYANADTLTYMLDLLKRAEKRLFHKQLVDAMRTRISVLSDRLGVSAVDRLGEIVA